MEASSVVLKPCSAVTAREGCSTESEREAMEVSSIVDDSRQRKRKAELDPEDEEEEESDGEVEEDRIEDTDLLEVPEWDVDSFDGVVYSSSSDPDLPPCYQPCENMEQACKDYRIYKKHIITSKGFMVKPSLRPYHLYKGIRPLKFNDRGFNRDYCEKIVFVS